MESIENFMTIFIVNWKDKNNDGLTRILKDTHGFLQNVSKADGERALEILLDEERGLFTFIESTLNQKSQMTKLGTSLKESFNALQFIMEFFNQKYEPYIKKTKEICVCCIKTFCWFYTRKSAAETLKKLIKLFPNYDMQLNEIIEHYNDRYLSFYTKKDGCVFYIVLGTIARYCPEIEIMKASSNSIFLNLLNDFEMQYKLSQDKQQEDIKIYVDCFLDMFVNFVPFYENIAKKDAYFKKLYMCLSQLCEPEKAQKTLKFKVINLLSTFIKHFSPLIFKDYKKWHEEILNNSLEEDESYIYQSITALRAFYKAIVIEILKENNENAFLYFKNYYLLNISKRDLTNRNSRLIVFGLGELSEAYIRYAPKEIYKLFQMIALRTLPFYAKEYEIEKKFEAILDYLHALSQILRHIPNISLHHVNVVIELSLQFIKRFPELKTNRNYAAKTLKRVFINIDHLEKNFQHEYFNSLFREGVLWSCSHTLLIDIELQQEIENLKENPICCKDYVPLWQALFKIDEQEENIRFLISQLFEEFLLVLISFIDKLNLNVKVQENSSFYNISFALIAENEADFRFFINLVDLYVEIFEDIESSLFQNWTEKLLVYFIKYSYKYPMISGFYKFISSIFKKSDLFLEQLTLSKPTQELISQYLFDVLEIVSGFSGELQLSCIYLIFNTPILFIPDFSNNIITIFKIAFNIGLTDLSLAFRALDTLEIWIKNTNNISNEFLKNVIFYIEPYLSSEESALGTIQDITKNKKETIKKVTSADADENLKDFQERILLFYGSLDSNILFDFIHEKSIHTNATWNKKNLLQCELLFPDIRLEMFFDIFIPRIIELTNSGDRKTKISACEFLHTIITVILGKKLMDQCFTKNLCFTILKLGCDADDAAKNLFQPLVIQLTHYMSSKLMKESRIPQEFVDLLFDGLTEEFNSSLRDYCGLCLKEFVEWSFKQSSDSDITNVRSIIRRITNFALYPSNKKRTAAAIAFNYLYTILRENTNIINMYWLEFLYVFVKSMEECDDMQTIYTLNHIEKVIKIKSSIFIAKSPNRRRPPDFSEATLKGTLIWLFSKCGSTSTKCRIKCVELFESFLPLISDYQSVKNQIINDINIIALKNLKENLETVTINDVKAFLRTLDFYIWISNKNILSFDSALKLENPPRSREIFSQYFKKIVFTIINQNMHSNLLHTNTLMETEEFESSINEVTLKILEFMSIILSKEENDPRIILWHDDLYLLITRCTLYPHKVGLTTKKLEIMQKLPKQLEILLTLMLERLPSENLLESRKNFSIESAEYFADFTQIRDIVDMKKNIYDLKCFVEGLLILNKCKFFDLEKEHNFTIDYFKQKIVQIFETLKHEATDDDDTCEKLDVHVEDYLEVLMMILLNNYQVELMQFLLNLVTNDCPLVKPNGSKIAHGEYFLETFKKPIFQYMLKNSVKTMEIVDGHFIEFPDKIFSLIENLLIFVQHNKTTESDMLVDEMFKRCNNFQRLLNDIENRKTKFFNINRIAITLKNKPTEAIKNNDRSSDLYLWILEELVGTTDLEKKTMFLKSFLICLADEESTQVNPELSLVFRQLRDVDSAVWLKKLESDDSLKFQASSCLQALLKGLIITNSSIVYQAVIKFAVGAYKLLFKDDINEYLNPYFASISETNALKSLQIVYKIFMDTNLTNERFEILKYFLLPSMELNKTAVIEKFYEEKCEEMIMYLRKKIDSNLNSVDRKKTIVSKIGFYNMFELMFAKFELKFLEINDSVTKTKKPVNQILIQEILNLRCLSALNEEEKEITRILQCSALNCCISTISLKEEEKYYKFIFVEDRKKDQLIWERIIDCNKKYDFQQAPKMIRKDRKKLINIRKTIKNGQNPFGPSASYFHRYNLISLTLLEDVHAYDLNDTAVLAQAKTNTEKDQRLDLNFENDEFNDHECMPMITGVIMHLFNNEITSLPDLNQQTNNPPPDYFKFFLNGFMTKIDNVRLFLMKIITNTKNAFLPYIKSFFKPITVSITRYLENNSLNYIIRDILIILIESKYEAKENIEKDAAQNLIEHLIKRAPDPNTNVYKYNLEIIESLCKLWSPKYSQNFSMIINWDSHLALQTIVILLRSYNYDSATNLIAQPEIRKLIEDSVEKWRENESRILWIFEAVGWLLRLSNEENFQAIITNLLTHLNRMKQINSERCAQSVCTIFKVCRDKAHICRELFKFANPKDVADNYKAACFELFYHRIPDIEPINLSTELLLIDLESVLNKRILACEESALKIIERLVPLVSESKMRLYLKLVLNYTGATSSLLENRKLAFSILMETYLKYRPPHDFGILSSRTLVRALDDPAEEIQEFVLTFWREKIKLPETCYDRFIFLLDIYDPELQDHFARFLCLMMLDLTYKSLDSNRSMFKPLIDCTFRDYELFVPKRRANLGSMAPLFAPSLASQLSRASQLGLSHQGTFAATLRILATRELEFEPTAQIQSDSSSQFEETAKIPNPSQNKLSKRLTTFPNFKPEIIQKRNEYHKKLQKEVEYRRNNAKFYRKYRIGDFPDVELSQASFVESLRRLIMKDWLACKDLTVLLVRTMIERLEGNERYKDSINKIFNKFEEILQEQREVGHNFTLILLEIILHGFSKKIEMNANSVRKICKATSNYSLGILSLEKNILLEQAITEEVVEEPPNKRQKVESLEKQNWIELAGLYKHQNETDIVNSIFKREGLLNEKAREGALAQAEKNWLKAKNAYEEAYEVALDSEKEYCLEGMFECLAELSSWSQINEKIEIIIDKNYNSVWENPLKKQLLPWIFEAQMQNTLEKYTTSTDLDDDTFISNFKEWIQNSQMMTIKKHFGEEMSVFYLMDDKFEGTARHCLKSCIDHVREQWIRLSPLSESIRISIFLKLRGISNIDNYLSMDKSTDLQNKTTELIQYWDKHLPSENEDLLSWNKHVLYRLNFAFHLYGKLKDFDDESSTLNDIIAAMARQRIKISELAMKNKNNIVAKKHTLETEKLIDNLDSDEFSKLKSEFILAASKYKFICSQIESNVKKRYKYYISSWKIANDILMDTNVDISTKIKAQYHIFDLTLTLQRSEKNNFELLNFLINDDFIASNIEASDDLEILGGLKDYSFNILKSTCGTGNDKEMAESYTRFGKYCYNLVFDGCDRNFYLVKEFISSILNAMSLGSLEAAHYFPCLLKHEYYHDNEEVTELFISLSENVPSWMFLFWQSQIMSYLSKPISRILVSIVKRLIMDYPNGVMYNFRQTYEAQPDLKMKPEIREMHEILFANSKFKTFFEALHYVCQPEYYLRHHLLKALDSIECYVENVDLLLGQLSVFVDQEVIENSLQGLLYKELGKYRSYIEKCKSMEYDTAKQFVKNVADDLYKAMKKRIQNKYQALQLKDYSPYLSNFSGEDFEIEIPGQYSNIKKPLTRYHTKILKFDRFIKVMESKYNPIKINLIGNDSRTYGFLVKFGEDLRQDQRLQQIFEIVNKTLSTDSNCKNRYLSINTYQVVPLSNSLGLIQWVDETRSLKEFIQFTMDNKEIMQIVMNKYQNWINKAGNYKKAVLKYNANDVSSKMNEFINDFEWDYLKKTFMILSPSLECFVSLRRNFITNYATMCIIHWITGVGDRHVENMLIEVKTGKCYGIDFGMAFGTGINQIPPELVPFRLTTQILGLLKPFDKYALFGITMTHVLNAIRKEKGPVLACLNVFINEPLNWSKHVNKQTEDNKNNEEYIDVKWSPRNIISIIKKKLEGVKPSMIMLEELDNAFEVNNYEDEYLFKCKHIINGTDCHNLSLRSRMKDFNLTPEEQVQCLLEQATDLNVLGRMWVGWCPFV